MRRSVIYAAPIILFLGLLGIFFSRIDADPGEVPFVLLDTPLPPFQLAGVTDRESGLSSDDVIGRVSLMNVFASWCAACLYEHPTFMTLKDTEDLPLYGINWRERTPQDGARWLTRHGNPYHKVGSDPIGQVAVALGVTQAPQTFVVDARGTIRYRHDGPITEEVWTTILHPIVDALRLQSEEHS